MPMSSQTSSNFTHPRSYIGLNGSDPVPAPRWRLAFLRGIIWSLIGMIYAPLFTGLVEFSKVLGVGDFAYVIAAALAGGVGAVLYGAREVALISTGLGVAVGVATLILVAEQVTFIQSALIAAVLAAVVGLTIPFPARCSRNVAGKAWAGLIAGACGGGVLAIVEPLHPAPFSLFAVLAFLVSVNGVLYVTTVKWWVSLSRRMCLASQPCYLVESLIMAILAGVAAGSVWMMSGPLLNPGDGIWREASIAMTPAIPQAVLGGLIGGGTAGMLLELFRFSWVHDL